jgi:AcrR family transcriptional regulator
MTGLATPGGADSSRARAAETKRARSRAALLEAGGRLFRERGWVGTRMEDIAHEAGLSPATAYNHFESKHHLIGTIYAPIFWPLLEQADRAIQSDAPIVDALRDVLREAARLARSEQALTVALVGAVVEVTTKVGAPVSANDPRLLVPFPYPVRDLIAEGQRRGELTPTPPATDAAAFMTNAMLLRLMTRPHESAESDAEITLTFLLGGMLPS